VCWLASDGGLHAQCQLARPRTGSVGCRRSFDRRSRELDLRSIVGGGERQSGHAQRKNPRRGLQRVRSAARVPNQVSTLPRTDSEIVARLFIDLEPSVAVAIGQTAYSYNDDMGEAGAGGEGGAGGKSGAGEGGESGERNEAAGSAGRDQESMGGAGEGGEAGSDRVETAGTGGANAGAGRAGSAGNSSPGSSGCSLSGPTDPKPWSFALAIGGALLAMVRRRRMSQYRR
jgi:MYXO-CTERM domain-containing protein